MLKLFNTSSRSDQKAFTIVELLVVIGMISIVTAVALPAFAMMQKNISLKNYTKEIVSNLRQAQNLAVTKQDGVNHGIYFLNTGYSDCKDVCTAVTTSTFPISNGISIIEGQNKSIIFDRKNGDRLTINPNDTDKIVVGFSGGKHNTIQVNGTGLITATY